LYSITLGETFMPDIAIDYAKEELIKRGINELTIGKFKRKWELENLIEDERFEDKQGKRPHWIFILIVSIFFLIIGILALCDLVKVSNNAGVFGRLFLFIIAFWGLIMTVFEYKKDQKRKARSNRIKNLINEL